MCNTQISGIHSSVPVMQQMMKALRWFGTDISQITTTILKIGYLFNLHIILSLMHIIKAKSHSGEYLHIYKILCGKFLNLMLMLYVKVLVHTGLTVFCSSNTMTQNQELYWFVWTWYWTTIKTMSLLLRYCQSFSCFMIETMKSEGRDGETLPCRITLKSLIRGPKDRTYLD